MPSKYPMKLLLTSAGLTNKILADFFVSSLPKTPGACSALMVAYAQNQGEHDYAEALKNELLSTGIGAIELFNLQEDRLGYRESPDVIYVCGGNTFAMLHRMRLTGTDQFIRSSVEERGSVYVGVSAGSIMAGPSIEIAGWGSEGDENAIGLKDLAGFGFTEVLVFPHFKSRLQREIDDFRGITAYPVVELTDEQAVLVDDRGYRVIGG
jgi:peptidase E